MTLNRVGARTADGRIVLENLSLTFGAERTGLVGCNGSGKSTLLSLLAGRAEPYEGSISRAGSVAWLEQHTEPPSEAFVGDALGVSSGLAILRRLLAGQAEEDDLAEVDWTLEERLGGVLTWAGLSGLDPSRSVSSLSGGEQTRLRLAALKLQKPQLLLLDEPSNHLDADGRARLATLLARWPGGLVMASHDRTLLAGMDRIIELSKHGAAVYGGGYDFYAEQKAAEREAAEQALNTAQRGVDEAARDNRRAAERKSRRDRAGRAFALKRSEPKILLGRMAERAERTAGKERGLAEMRRQSADARLAEAKEKVEAVSTLDIPLPPARLPPGRTVLEIKEARWDAPDGRCVLGPMSMAITGPERVAITGPNGAGKSTLLKLVAGLLEPSVGVVRRAVPCAFLDQDAALLNPEETLLENWRRLNPGGTENQAYAALARFLFRNLAAVRKVSSLSGGERIRAALACVMTGPQTVQLLMLDEPTNHLDLEAMAAVEAALRRWDGALVVASHDVPFLEAIGADRRVNLGQPQPTISPRRRAATGAEVSTIGLGPGRP